MTLRLTVDADAWRSRVAAVAAGFDHRVIAVVKGNGYGFGRRLLVELAAELLPAGTDVAVGTADELAAVAERADAAPATRSATGGSASSAGLPWQNDAPGPTPRVHVLVPAGDDHAVRALAGATTALAGRVGVVAMVGSAADARRLSPGTATAVTVKLRSSMRRFGVGTDEVADVVAATPGGIAVDGLALHLPLAGTSTDRVAEATALIDALDADSLAGAAVPRRLSLSHISPADFAALRAARPAWELRMRVGTALWHGDKAELQLTAGVAAVSPIRAGERAGYHGTPAPDDGWVVVVGAGSANGVTALDDGRSPFHHRRRRVALLEHPHMHSSMLFVPRHDPVPAIGETVDVQRPLTTVTVDELCWR